jgi:hypothetical protein
LRQEGGKFVNSTVMESIIKAFAIIVNLLLFLITKPPTKPDVSAIKINRNLCIDRFLIQKCSKQKRTRNEAQHEKHFKLFFIEPTMNGTNEASTKNISSSQQQKWYRCRDS